MKTGFPPQRIDIDLEATIYDANIRPNANILVEVTDHLKDWRQRKEAADLAAQQAIQPEVPQANDSNEIVTKKYFCFNCNKEQTHSFER